MTSKAKTPKIGVLMQSQAHAAGTAMRKARAYDQQAAFYEAQAVGLPAGDHTVQAVRFFRSEANRLRFDFA